MIVTSTSRNLLQGQPSHGVEPAPCCCHSNDGAKDVEAFVDCVVGVAKLGGKVDEASRKDEGKCNARQDGTLLDCGSCSNSMSASCCASALELNHSPEEHSDQERQAHGIKIDTGLLALLV